MGVEDTEVRRTAGQTNSSKQKDRNEIRQKKQYSQQAVPTVTEPRNSHCPPPPVKFRRVNGDRRSGASFTETPHFPVRDTIPQRR